MPSAIQPLPITVACKCPLMGRVSKGSLGNRAREARSSTHTSLASAMQETPYGLLRSPLGSARLTVIALLAVLLRTGLHAAEQAVIEAGLLKRCSKLFVDYPFNSILHHQACF